jgi:hypothetical protein
MPIPRARRIRQTRLDRLIVWGSSPLAIGLAILAFTIWSGRMGCGYRGYDCWQHKMERMQAKMDWMRTAGSRGARPDQRNRAFDEYRTETLRRLETSSANSGFLSGCASPRTRPSSMPSWPNAAAGRNRNRRRRRPELRFVRLCARPSAFPEAGGLCVCRRR